MNPPFTSKLADAIEKNQSLLCVGLDPDPAMLPVDDVLEFHKEIIESTSDLVCAYKPNIAFFEAMGEAGRDVLVETMRLIPPDVPVIVDAKRGDIGNTAAAYAKAIFDELGADAITANPYGGKDAMEPFLEYEDKGILVWCRSSNPSAVDFQDLMLEDKTGRRPLWQVVALRAKDWNRNGNVGLVVGATYPEQLVEARALCPEMPILVPGIGAQEGSLRDAVRAGLTKSKDGAIISASRGVLYASRGSDYGLAARAAAVQLRDHINRHRLEAAAAIDERQSP